MKRASRNAFINDVESRVVDKQDEPFPQSFGSLVAALMLTQIGTAFGLWYNSLSRRVSTLLKIFPDVGHQLKDDRESRTEWNNVH